MLLEESLSPCVEQTLGLRNLGNRNLVWADDYRDHCRRVLTLFKINSAFATLQWGLNFDFVPVIQRSKDRYARTDRSIQCQVFELPFAFWQSDYRDEKRRAEYNRVVLDSTDLDLNHFNESVQQRIGSNQKVFASVLPAAQAFFERTSSYDGIVSFIKEQKEIMYYRFINGNGLLLSECFVEQYLGNCSKAQQHFSALNFRDDELRASIYKKLKQTPMHELP